MANCRSGLLFWARIVELEQSEECALSFSGPAHTIGTGCRRKMENRVQQFLDEVAQLHSNGAISLVSVILFGSAASGAFSQSSDVDLILVIPDETSPEDRRLLRAEVTELEIRHGLRLPEGRSKKPL